MDIARRGDEGKPPSSHGQSGGAAGHTVGVMERSEIKKGIGSYERAQQEAGQAQMRADRAGASGMAGASGPSLEFIHGAMKDKNRPAERMIGKGGKVTERSNVERHVKLKVMWKFDWKTGEQWAWYDSDDGFKGGMKLRVHILLEHQFLIRKYDLFPHGPYLFTVQTQSGRTVELPYVAYNIVSADSEGPPGMVLVAPGGIKFPKDAEFVLPSLEKQLEFKKFEGERIAAIMDSARLGELEIQVASNVAARKYAEKKKVQDELLGERMKQARTEPSIFLGQEALEPETEYAVWRHVKPQGVPPPPHKHPIMLRYEFVWDVEVAASKDNGFSFSTKEFGHLQDSTSKIEMRVHTLEIWRRDFKVRWNIYFSLHNNVTGAALDPSWANIQLMTWEEIHIFDTDECPPARDAPALLHDGDKLMLFGGKTSGGNYKTFFSDFWTYDYMTNKWTQYEDEVHTTDQFGSIQHKKGLHGKKPSARSSAQLILKENALFIAGGSEREGKTKDLRKLDLETWTYSQVAKMQGKKHGLVDPEQQEQFARGNPPPKGFASRNMVLENQFYAPLINDKSIFEYCLMSNAWRKMQVEKLLAWETTKLVISEDAQMIRFSAIDFRGQGEARMPCIETAQAWRVFGKLDESDHRDLAPRDWILQSGQTLVFDQIPAFGDSPGSWTAQGVTSGYVSRSRERRTTTKYFVFGGCRSGGVPTAKRVPSRRQIVLGRDCPVKPGVKVQLIPSIVEQVRFGRVVSTQQPGPESVRSSSRGSNQSRDQSTIKSGIVVAIGGRKLKADEETPRGADARQSCMVLWEDASEPQNHRTGFQNEYELALYVDYSQYQISDHITNELFSVEIVEGAGHRALLQEMDQICSTKGFTDKSTLESLLGPKVRIKHVVDQRKPRQAQARKASMSVDPATLTATFMGTESGGNDRSLNTDELQNSYVSVANT